jgi:two-component system response regulator AtoC
MAKSRILIVDDEKLIRWSLEKNLDEIGYEVASVDQGLQALSIIRSEIVDLVLLDIRLPDVSGVDLLVRIKEQNPDMPVVMITADDTVGTAITCMKSGAYDYILKPFDLEEVIMVVEKSLAAASLKRECLRLRHEVEAETTHENIVGESASMAEVFSLLEKVSKSNATTILLQGESGTGKDLIARAIHFGSERRERPFLVINCAALPENLLESELMGHEKGAFTDAKSAKKGCFEVADGGTVYLDEIGEMKVSMQAKLLRIIENKSFKRLGGLQDIKVDVRIIAATNRDLESFVGEAAFREDLYYRLKVIPIDLPPLRERKEDIPFLVSHFISRFNAEFKRKVKGISPEAQELLMNYDWPGNVRELKNVIERAIILESEEIILPEHLPAELRNGMASERDKRAFQLKIPPHGLSIEKLEESLLRQALMMTGKNQTKAAKLLGLGRDALRYRMRKIGMLA